MNEVLAAYEKELSNYQQQLNQLKKQQVNLGLYRLLAFSVAVLCIYLIVNNGNEYYILAALIAFALFIYLVRKYIDKKEEKTLTEKLVFICQNELNILNGKPNQFSNGNEHSSNEKYFSDLDIFGPGSIFHLLNRTSTVIGSDTLAAQLKQSATDKERIGATQEAVKELKNQLTQRQLLTAKGLLYQYDNNDLTQINQWLSEKDVLTTNKWYPVALWLLPVISIAALMYWMITGTYYPFVIATAINWSHIGRNAKHISTQHQLMGKKQELLNQYSSILSVFHSFKIDRSSLLNELDAISINAYTEIKQLSQISSFFDQRLNMLVQLFLNSTVLYDLQCLWRLEKWKQKNKTQLNQWLTAVGQIEYLNSLAGFAYNNPGYCFPVIKEDKPYIKAKGMSHPLIPAKERVLNDFEIGLTDKLQLVTGSNMSGKTTFLRSVGINVLLAQCGAPVCATAFEFTPLHILSSIRVSDSLQEHTSYFMAELKKLHVIVEELATGKPSLVLIDEILRGTNSDDKSHGSEQFIKKLLPTNSITLFATHDLSLGSLETAYPDLLSNYCFESTIQNGELSFDYRLRKGIAQNKNASFLMEKMGII